MSMSIIIVRVCSQRIPIAYLKEPSCFGLYGVISFTTCFVTALVESCNGTWWTWSHVTKGSYKTSAIFRHAAIGSLATSALAALLIFIQAHGTTHFPFSIPFFSFISSLIDNPIIQACLHPFLQYSCLD